MESDRSKECFKKGSIVEICSDEDGFRGAWFPATLLEVMGRSKFLIQHQSFTADDDDQDFLKEEVDHLHIRPCPPQLDHMHSFDVLDEVDALYNDVWWVGVISKVLEDSKYKLFFRENKEEMEFKHSQLRHHQDWIDGNWVLASQALKLKNAA